MPKLLHKQFKNLSVKLIRITIISHAMLSLIKKASFISPFFSINFAKSNRMQCLFRHSIKICDRKQSKNYLNDFLDSLEYLN